MSESTNATTQTDAQPLPGYDHNNVTVCWERFNLTTADREAWSRGSNLDPMSR